MPLIQCLMAGFINKQFLFFATFWICFSYICYGQVKILSPSSLVADIHGMTGTEYISAATATFGAPTYGESFVGRLFPAETNTHGCDNDYQARLLATDFNHTTAEGVRKILVLPRGECTFVRKVAVAETIGADAVMVIDFEDSKWHREDISRAIMADDGSGSKVRIPSVLISYEDSKPIVKTLQRDEPVLVQLIWALPQKSIVDVGFWTESGSFEGQRFLKSYAYHATELRGKLHFIPHYYVYSLSSNGALKHGDYNLCWDQEGLFCANPPDMAAKKVTGRDVLEENVRQLCLFRNTATEVDGITGSLYSGEWWEYMRRFPDACPLSREASNSTYFGEECSYSVMKSIPGIRINQIKDCVKQNARELLEKERSDRAWSSLALRINGAKFSGSLDPIIVTRAVCAAFEHPPDVCLKLTGLSSITPAAPLTLHHTLSPSRLITAVILLLGTMAGGLYAYQRYLRKSMRTALRQEVMLEVRSQLQEYQQLDDDALFKHLQRKPLIS